jgi:hypothetical protein
MGREYGIFLKTILAFGPRIYKYLNMDKNPEPGFAFWYSFSKIIGILILCLILWVCYKILHFVFKYSKMTKQNIIRFLK